MAAFADSVVISLCPKPLRLFLKEPDLREASDGAQRVHPQIVRGDDAPGFGGLQDRTRPRSDACDGRAWPELVQPEPARITVPESCAFEPTFLCAGKSNAPAAADRESDEGSCPTENSRVEELRHEIASYREERKRANEESERFSIELEKLRAAVEERDKEVLALKALGLGVEAGEQTPGHIPKPAQNTEAPAGLPLTREGSVRMRADSQPEEGPPWCRDWQDMCDLAMQPMSTPRPASVWTGDAGGTGWGTLKAPELSWDSERAILERALLLAGVEGGAKWVAAGPAGPAYGEARPIQAAWEAADVRNDVKPEAKEQNIAGGEGGQSWPREQRTARSATMKPAPSSAPASPTPVADNRHLGFPAPSFEKPNLDSWSALGDGRGGRGFLPSDRILNLVGDRNPDGDRAKVQTEAGREGYIDLIVKEKEKCEKYMNQTMRLGDELQRKLAFCAELLGNPAEDEGINKGALALDAPAKDVGIQFKSTRKISYRHSSATFPGSATVP